MTLARSHYLLLRQVRPATAPAAVVRRMKSYLIAYAHLRRVGIVYAPSSVQPPKPVCVLLTHGVACGDKLIWEGHLHDRRVALVEAAHDVDA